MSWQPGAGLQELRQRARLLTATRTFFAQRQVLEVNTPVLASASATDPGLESFTCTYSGPPGSKTLYLQTSPEFFMKRLLAAGSGPIYQLGPCFRNGEHSERHNPEFWMLEWYRPGWSLTQLQEEAAAFIDYLLGPAPYKQLTYKQAFVDVLGINPFTASLETLRQASHKCSAINAQLLDRDACLDLLVSHQLEPALKQKGRVFVTEFPASQAALAEIGKDAEGHLVARRFELYIQGLEIANAYQELTAAREQAQRFAQDNKQRRKKGKPQIVIDQQLLQALESGLPSCSGIALGFDRLMLLAAEADNLDQVQAFSLQRC